MARIVLTATSLLVHVDGPRDCARLVISLADEDYNTLVIEVEKPTEAAAAINAAVAGRQAT